MDELYTKDMVAPVLPDAALLMKDHDCVEDIGRKWLFRLLDRLEFDPSDRKFIVVSNVLEVDEFGARIQQFELNR